MIWTPYDWLNKSYYFYMPAVVGIVSIVVALELKHSRNQPNKTKLVLFILRVI